MVFQAIMAVTMKVTIFWNVSPCSLVVDPLLLPLRYPSLQACQGTRHHIPEDGTKTLRQRSLLKLLLPLRWGPYDFKPRCVISPQVRITRIPTTTFSWSYGSKFHRPCAGMFEALIVNTQQVRKCANGATFLAYLLTLVSWSENR